MAAGAAEIAVGWVRLRGVGLRSVGVRCMVDMLMWQLRFGAGASFYEHSELSMGSEEGGDGAHAKAGVVGAVSLNAPDQVDWQGRWAKCGRVLAKTDSFLVISAGSLVCTHETRLLAIALSFP